MTILRSNPVRRCFVPVFALCAAAAMSISEAPAQTLAKIKERGSVICGVNPGLLGFSVNDQKNGWTGYDVDLCRALAAAIFDDPSKVQFVPTETTERLAAVQSGKIDVLSRNTTWTMAREASLKLNFAAVTYYGAGLVGYLAKGAQAAGIGVQPELAVAVSIPLIALAVWLGIRSLHRRAQAAADRDR